jgi:hypothetical protein
MKPINAAKQIGDDILSFALKGVSETAAKVPKKLNLKNLPDEQLHFKNTIEIQGSTFTSFAPEVFAGLRQHFDIDRESFRKSWEPEDELKSLPSEGRSGSFFYRTEDKRYFLKTVLKAEFKVMSKCLKAYVEYLVSKPDTLITKVFGLYQIGTNFFIVFENLLPFDFKGKRYDLKGRRPKKEKFGGERRYMPAKEPKDLVKDNEILRKFQIKDAEVDAKFHKQMERDTKFLQKIGVLDYSLFIGVYDQATWDAAKAKVEAEMAACPHRFRLYEAINPQTDKPEVCSPPSLFLCSLLDLRS